MGRRCVNLWGEREKSRMEIGKDWKLISGKGGVIRGVKLRTCGKGKYEFLNRPLQGLYLLEVSSSGIDRCEEEKNVVGDKYEKNENAEGEGSRGGEG